MIETTRYRKGRIVAGLAAVALVLVLVAASSLHFVSPLAGLHTAPAAPCAEGWRIVEDGVARPLVPLPVTIEGKEDTLVLQHAMTPSMNNADKVLALHANYVGISVWADEKLIYASPDNEVHVPSSVWHFIPMSKCQGASTLTVTLQSYYGDNVYWLDAPLLDRAETIYQTLLEENTMVGVFSVFCLLLALGLAVCGGLLYRWRTASYRQLWALAAFVFLSGMWVFLDAKILDLVGGNLAVTYFLCYAVFFLLPAPYIFYVRTVTQECTRFFTVLIWLTLANAVCGFMLHLSGLIMLPYMTAVVHGIIVAAVLASNLAFWRNRSRRMCFTAVGVAVVSVCVLVSLVLFYMHFFVAGNASSLYIIGLTVLLTAMAADGLLLFGRFWRRKSFAERTYRLVLEDAVTGLGNRYAMDLQLNALFERAPEAVAVVVFDIDGLKRVNDTLGRAEGDALIRLVAQQIQTDFGILGNCYRTGGEEFDVLVYDRWVDEVPEALSRFEKVIASQWDAAWPSKGVSAGWAMGSYDAVTPFNEGAFVRLRAKADEALYHAKQTH